MSTEPLVSPDVAPSVKERVGRGRTHTPANTLPPDFPRILRLPAVEAAAGFKKSKIYAMVKEGQFPQPVRLGNKSVGWLADEVQGWISARAAQRA